MRIPIPSFERDWDPYSGRRHAVVGEAGSLEDAISLIDRIRPEVVVIDKDIPGGGGFALLDHLAELPLAPFVMLSADSMDDREMKRARSLNAACIIGKNNQPDAYLHCLATIMTGKSCCLVDIVSEQSEPSRLGTLTRREIEIARLVGQARRNDEIAEQFNLTIGTVKVHLSRIYKKLGLRSRGELLLYVRKHAVG